MKEGKISKGGQNPPNDSNKRPKRPGGSDAKQLRTSPGYLIQAIDWECPECGAQNVQPVDRAPHLDHVGLRYCGHCNEQFTIDLILRTRKNV